MKKNVIFSGVAILAALSLAACGGGKKAEEGKTTAAAEQGSQKATEQAGEKAEAKTAETDGKSSFRTVDEIKKSGVIRIGVCTDKAPFGYVDEKGVNQGYDVY